MSVGENLERAMKQTAGERMTDLFNMIRPLFAFTWENVI